MTGFAAPAGGRVFSIANVGFGLAAGATVADPRTIGLTAADGPAVIAGIAGFDPADGAAFAGGTDLAGDAAEGRGALTDETSGFGPTTGALTAGAGATALTAAAPGESGPLTVTIGFGLITGATVVNSCAPLCKFPTGIGPAV